jgi:NhaP-type Na+/H+ or K+/H+ antiporter
MHSHKSESLDDALTSIVVGLLWAIFTGIAIGLLSGLFTLLTFMWMQHRSLDAKAEVAFTVGMAYLSFFIAQVFCKGSGCVATVVFGLFGSATLLFGMSQKARQSLIFPQFWNVFMFLVNSLIFFYVGAASVNFAIRSGQSLFPSGLGSLFALTLYRLPIIWLASFALRGILLFASSHCLKLMRLSEGLGWRDIIFITVGGLRGSLSLGE